MPDRRAVLAASLATLVSTPLGSTPASANGAPFADTASANRFMPPAKPDAWTGADRLRGSIVVSA